MYKDTFSSLLDTTEEAIIKKNMLMKEWAIFSEHSVSHFHLTVCENIGSDQGRVEKAFCLALQAINLL